MNSTQTNYRPGIAAIAARYARPGEDLEAAMLNGAPATIDAIEAHRISLWLRTEADSEWGEDERHRQMAAEIADLIY